MKRTLAAVDCVSLLLIALALIAAGDALMNPDPLPPPLAIAPGSETGSIRFYDRQSFVEFVHYSEKDKTVTVTEHAPRDLLICIKGRCDLAEGWIGK